jgi:hypothetical protein
VRLRLTRKSAETPPVKEEPPRLQLRWLIILSLAGAVTLTLSVEASPALGIPVGIAIIGLLHTIIE